MIRIFSLILFVIISNKVIASVEGKTLICDKDKRGYNFMSKDEVKTFFVKIHIIWLKMQSFFKNHLQH